VAQLYNNFGKTYKSLCAFFAPLRENYALIKAKRMLHTLTVRRNGCSKNVTKADKQKNDFANAVSSATLIFAYDFF